MGSNYIVIEGTEGAGKPLRATWWWRPLSNWVFVT